jgi:hypothetical protein
MNEDDNCFPDKPCPKGFELHAEDETGTCYPIEKPPCPAIQGDHEAVAMIAHHVLDQKMEKPHYALHIYVHQVNILILR